MESFRSIAPNVKSLNPIGHDDHIFTIGSCFAEEIYTKLHRSFFKIIPSPFGIVFNPISMARQLSAIMSKKRYGPDELIFHNGQYHSMDHHGKYSSDSLGMLDIINDSIYMANTFVPKCRTIILTFGTSYFYTYLPNNQVVANCHKFPAHDFSLTRASTQMLIDKMFPAMEALIAINPQVRCIVSVSPVRYLKNGMVENNRSKASLLLLCEALEKTFSQVEYFPAFELVNDDLRDYRFFKRDLAHPNELAVDYIWAYFKNRYFDETTNAAVRDFEKYYLLTQHIPMSGNNAKEDHQKKIESEKQILKNKYPQLDLL